MKQLENTPSKTNPSNPPAVILGLDYITGLQSARILAKRRVPVIGVARDRKHFACRTRVCQSIHFVGDDGDVLHTLRSIGRQRSTHEKAVLIPCEDQFVALVSRHREELSAWFHIALPSPQTVEMLMDKIQFYAFAERRGLPIPRTFIVRERADAHQAAAELSYPCIVKPPGRSQEWSRHTHVKAFKVHSQDELLALYDRCRTWVDALIVQQWIPGGDDHLYSCNCYFDRQGQVTATFTARKLRQWPPQAGDSCLGEECRNDEVLNEAMRLFESVDYRGLGYLELKRDTNNGRYFIVEPNIGRPTGRSAIAEAGGVELLYSMYCDMIGRPLPVQRQQYCGVKWIQIRKDCQSAYYYWRRGELRAIDWWKSWRGEKTYAVFSWADPLPFLADLWSVARSALSPRSHRKRNFHPATVAHRHGTPSLDPATPSPRPNPVRFTENV